jgi:hypothetical protein
MTTTSPSALLPAGGSRPQRGARMVLDVEFVLDGVVADLIATELARGGLVQVVLLPPRPAWSTDAALVLGRHRRLAAARRRRIQELIDIAGCRAAQVTVSIQRHRWRPSVPARNLASYRAESSDQKGKVH